MRMRCNWLAATSLVAFATMWVGGVGCGDEDDNESFTFEIQARGEFTADPTDPDTGAIYRETANNTTLSGRGPAGFISLNFNGRETGTATLIPSGSTGPGVTGCRYEASTGYPLLGDLEIDGSECMVYISRYDDWIEGTFTAHLIDEDFFGSVRDHVWLDGRFKLQVRTEP